ncbi:hypothetical protein [Variovorax fucosicus]|uniref:hypothetical protein n=1 Tax=Variovorax fucosicus TaxID=3053517 RepID=UPI00257591C1|nr:hypothetical protein [Variovorax sp. J22G47]MDM0056466.1 hypothetical protein [Variovorax sp. J22G47]
MANLASRSVRCAERAALVAALLVATASAVAAPVCAVRAHDLLGSWQSGSGPFEQMAFSMDNGRPLFNSWLHDRPDVSGGSWQLTGCALRISSGRGDAQWNLEVATLSAKRLTVRERGQRKLTTYRRIP